MLNTYFLNSVNKIVRIREIEEKAMYYIQENGSLTGNLAFLVLELHIWKQIKFCIEMRFQNAALRSNTCNLA